MHPTSVHQNISTDTGRLKTNKVAGLLIESNYLTVGDAGKISRRFVGVNA